MDAPAISVLLPVRDGLPYLSTALASISRQTFEDFEVLLEDDGSTDGSVEIAQAAARGDSRFRVVRGAPQGIVAALNAAAARARGELLVRMDADDVCAPERFERLAGAAARHPEVGFLSHRVRYFPREAVRGGMRRYEEWVNSVLSHDEIVRNRFVECPLPHPSWAVRRDVFDGLAGYREGPFPEDYDFFLRAVNMGTRFSKLPEVLLDWREGAHRLSRKDERYGLDRFRALKVEHLVPFLREEERPVAIAGAGRDGKRFARALIEAGVRPAYFVEVHPGRVGQRIHGACVIGYDQLSEAAGAFVLGAVGQTGAREEVRRMLAEAGLEEGVDFLSVQ